MPSCGARDDLAGPKSCSARSAMPRTSSGPVHHQPRGRDVHRPILGAAGAGVKLVVCALSCHVARRPDWEAAQASGSYPIPGGGPFIHCCFPEQLAGGPRAVLRAARTPSCCS